MTKSQLARVAALTGHKQQKEIAALLGLSRSAIHKAQKGLGLKARRFPSPQQEKTIIRLLESGKGVLTVGAVVGFKEGMIRAVAQKHGFRRKPGQRGCRYRLTAAQRERISEDILRRADYLNNLALKHNVGHKTVIKLAHELLGVERFRSGRSVEPLTSDEPLNPQTIANIAEKIVLNLFDGMPLPPYPVIVSSVIAAVSARMCRAKGIRICDEGITVFARQLAEKLRRRIGDAEIPIASGALVN